MSVSIDGSGKLIGVDQGLNIVGLTTVTNSLHVTGGSVGVGLNNPAEKVDILNGTLRLSRTSTYTAHTNISITHESSSNYGSLYLDTSLDTAGFLFRTGGTTERLRITGLGGHRIQCNESWHAANLSECNTAKLALNINKTRQGQTKGIAIGCVGGAAGSTGIQCYDTSNNSANNLELNPFGGNIGIGENTPYYKLHLKTNNNATSLSGGTGGNWGSDGIRIENENTTVGSMSLAHFRNYDADWHIGGKYVSANDSDFLFLSESNERLRITSDGNLGVGNDAPPVRLAIQDTTNCKLLLSSSWSGTQEIIFGGGSHNSTGSGNSTAAKIIVQASAPGGAATGYMSFYSNAGDNISERLRITPEGHKWTLNGSIFHGSSDVTDFTQSSRDTYNNVSIRAGHESAGTSPTNTNSAIKIYPAGTRSTTTGNLTGGIAWQHLDPNNGNWGTYYGAGAQIWMGASLHDTPGQERDRFNLWMNSQTTGNTNPNNLAIEAYPSGVVRHPKVPAFMVRNTSNASAFAANTRANWNTVILNNGSYFDTTNNIFTAPVDGIYNFSCMMLSNQNTRLFHNFRVNNTIIEGTRSESHAVSGSFQTNTITMVYSLSANDYVDVYVRNNQGYGGNYTNFNGFLVG